MEILVGSALPHGILGLFVGIIIVIIIITAIIMMTMLTHMAFWVFSWEAFQEPWGRILVLLFSKENSQDHPWSEIIVKIWDLW